MEKRIRLLVGIVLGVATLATVATAEEACETVISGNLNEKPATRGPELEKADIAIGNFLLLTIRNPAAGFTVAERERIVYLRLTEVISNERVDPDNFRLIEVRGKPTICVGKYRLITVYPNDAEAAGCSSEALAQKWLANLRANLPYVAPCASAGAPVTYDVGIGGVLLFRLRDLSDFATLRQRGAAVESRLVEVVSKDGVLPITVQPIGEEHAVYVGQQRIVTATEKDAKLARLKGTQQLAQSWADNLSKARPIIKAGLFSATE